jgi:hypothetical protein
VWSCQDRTRLKTTTLRRCLPLLYVCTLTDNHDGEVCTTLGDNFVPLKKATKNLFTFLELKTNFIITHLVGQVGNANTISGEVSGGHLVYCEDGDGTGGGQIRFGKCPVGNISCVCMFAYSMTLWQLPPLPTLTVFFRLLAVDIYLTFGVERLTLSLLPDTNSRMPKLPHVNKLYTQVKSFPKIWIAQYRLMPGSP